MLFVLYIIFCSFYRSNLNEDWKAKLSIIQRFFLVAVICQYLIELIAFGVRKNMKKEFVIETIACIYSFTFIAVKKTTEMPKEIEGI